MPETGEVPQAEIQNKPVALRPGEEGREAIPDRARAIARKLEDTGLAGDVTGMPLLNEWQKLAADKAGKQYDRDQVASQAGDPTAKTDRSNNDTVTALGKLATDNYSEDAAKSREDEESTREQDPKRAEAAAWGEKELTEKANEYQRLGLTDLAEKTRNLASEKEEQAKDNFDKHEQILKEIEPQIEEAMEDIAEFLANPSRGSLEIAEINSDTSIGFKKRRQRSQDKMDRGRVLVEEVATKLGARIGAIGSGEGFDPSKSSEFAFGYSPRIEDLASRFQASFARSYRAGDKLLGVDREPFIKDDLTITEAPTGIDDTIKLRRITSKRTDYDNFEIYEVVRYKK